MKKPHKLLAEKLLHISAIKLQPESPFVWASGWNSPIYTDNRVALSYPDVRNFIKVELARNILEHFPEANAIAGVATGAIAIGAIVADVLGLPYVYVRSTPKDHGLENMIEGNLKPGSKVVVIDDLISTATSSLKAVEAVEMAGCDAVGMACIFNFEFPEAVKRISDSNLSLASLLTYSEMLEVASDIDYITPSELETLQQWREDPSAWTPESF
ncbi:MAG: orotate phosphoribosyltransferase [Muribaculaceae bacterium]|nr:orotate phosphoribosyltransferase [Muribaculaceae bacterium]